MVALKMIKVGVIVSTHPSPSCKSKSWEYFFFSQDRLSCKRVQLENLRLVQSLNKDPRSKRRALNVSAIPAVVHFQSSYFRPEKTISLLNYLISKKSVSALPISLEKRENAPCRKMSKLTCTTDSSQDYGSLSNSPK